MQRMTQIGGRRLDEDRPNSLQRIALTDSPALILSSQSGSLRSYPTLLSPPTSPPNALLVSIHPHPAAMLPSSLQQTSSSSSSYPPLTESVHASLPRRAIWAMDHFSTKLRIPSSALYTTHSAEQANESYALPPYTGYASLQAPSMISRDGLATPCHKPSSIAMPLSPPMFSRPTDDSAFPAVSTASTDVAIARVSLIEDRLQGTTQAEYAAQLMTDKPAPGEDLPRLWSTVTAAHEKLLKHRTPYVCRLFQSQRCKQGPRCNQVHVRAEALQRLRAEITEQGTCCVAHTAPTTDGWTNDWIEACMRLCHLAGVVVCVTSVPTVATAPASDGSAACPNPTASAADLHTRTGGAVAVEAQHPTTLTPFATLSMPPIAQGHDFDESDHFSQNRKEGCLSHADSVNPPHGAVQACDPAQGLFLVAVSGAEHRGEVSCLNVFQNPSPTANTDRVDEGVLLPWSPCDDEDQAAGLRRRRSDRDELQLEIEAVRLHPTAGLRKMIIDQLGCAFDGVYTTEAAAETPAIELVAQQLEVQPRKHRPLTEPLRISKSELCRHYYAEPQKPYCKFGDDCWFVHLCRHTMHHLRQRYQLSLHQQTQPAATPSTPSAAPPPRFSDPFIGFPTETSTPLNASNSFTTANYPDAEDSSLVTDSDSQPYHVEVANPLPPRSNSFRKAWANYPYGTDRIRRLLSNRGSLSVEGCPSTPSSPAHLAPSV